MTALSVRALLLSAGYRAPFGPGAERSAAEAAAAPLFPRFTRDDTVGGVASLSVRFCVARRSADPGQHEQDDSRGAEEAGADPGEAQTGERCDCAEGDAYLKQGHGTGEGVVPMQKMLGLG
jgi:hypothetical protein